MGDKAYIFSTLTSSQEYRNYATGGADLPNVDKSVIVAGGANVPNKQLITQYGVMTTVDAEDLEWLERNEMFQLHKKNGFITVRDKPADPEKVAGDDMQSRDQSAPLVEEDFADNQQPQRNGAEEATTKPPAAPVKNGNSRRA